MAVKQGAGKKPRKHKESHGQRRGSKRQRLPELLLVMMGKGWGHRARRKVER